MQRILLLVALISIQATTLRGQLTLIYPTGGQKLPGNGNHVISWTNSANLYVSLYFDWYQTNGTRFIDNYILYTNTLPAGTNTFVLSSPARYPTEYLYKIRLVGTNTTTNVTNTSDYVYVTGTATLSGSITNENPWLPGQTRYLSVVWDGFQTNDVCKVILEAPTLNRGGYGFILSNLVIGAQSGTQVVAIPYPSSAPSAYGENHSLLDGPHMFRLYNDRCDITALFGSIDVVTVGLTMELSPSTASYILKGESNICAYITLDATLATNSVSVTNLGIIFTSFSTNQFLLKFSLKDGSTILGTNVLSLTPTSGSNYHTEVEFPMGLTVSAGQKKDLSLWCEVYPTSGIGTYIWTTDEISVLIQSHVDASYSSGASILRSVISSFGSYISVVEVVNPRFYLQSSTTNSMSFSVLCKPQTSYKLQSSTNLTTWTDLLTTNSVGDTLQLNITIGSSNNFFRLQEN